MPEAPQEAKPANGAPNADASASGSPPLPANAEIPIARRQQPQSTPVTKPTTAAPPFAPGHSRQGSMVSFQSPECEVQLFDQKDRPFRAPRLKPHALKSVRYYIMIVALMSPFVTTYSKTIMNFAITDMIDPEYLKSGAGAAADQPQANESRPYFDTDNSCPVAESDRERLMSEARRDHHQAQSVHGERFRWGPLQQGLLKAAYSIGHVPFQVVGSRLAEIYGPHLVLSGTAMLIGAACIYVPFFAALDFSLIFLDLVLLGILGSFMTPALITLFSNWLTPGEKSLFLSCYLIASRLGYALSSFLCSRLINAQLSWRYAFYTAGGVSSGFSVIFFLIARSRPREHPFVGRLELDYLATKNRLVRESLEEDQKIKVVAMDFTREPSGAQAEQADSKSSTKPSAPWGAILTNVPVWAFIITKFCVKMSGDTLQSELPVYLKRVMHLSSLDNGSITALSYVTFCIGCIVVGATAKYVLKIRPFGLSKTNIRKLFQCTGSFSVSLGFLAIAFCICDEFSTNLSILFVFSVTTLCTGGEAQMPFDLTEKYSGTIHAIGSSLAVSGIFVPIVVGYYLEGHAADRDYWSALWIASAMISALGGLVFLIFADANYQPFDNIDTGTVEEKTPKRPDEKRPENPETAGIETVSKYVDIGTNAIGPYRESRLI